MLKFSKKFKELLERVSYNRVSNHLLSISRLSKDSFDYNYISISDTNRLVTFTPSDKVEKVLSDLPIVYGVNAIRNLTHGNSNDTIFKLIGYDKSANKYWYPQPSCGCNNDGEVSNYDDGRPACGCDKGNTGTILNEVVSPTSGKTYVLYKCIDTDRLSVVNKEALIREENTGVIFTVNRNSIKIGRLVTNLLTTAGVKFVAKDIEDFVNLYKASYDFSTNKDIQFNIVSGNDIAYWYRKENYVSGGGQLTNSCMAEKEDKVFDIYTKNVNCSMVILYSDDGRLKQGSYESSKIKGRALLWDVIYKGESIKFLDRIYCNNDSDVELFKSYANNKCWWRKSEQSMYPEASVTNGVSEIHEEDGRFWVEVDAKSMNLIDGGWYPYMDTMCHWVEKDGKFFLTNDKRSGHNRWFRCTNGTYLKTDENGRETGHYGGAGVEECDESVEEVIEVEVPIEDQLDNGDCDIVDAPRQRQDNVEPAVWDDRWEEGRIRRESNVAEVQSMATAEDLDRVRELIIESSRVPREDFDNIPREVEPTPPPSEPVFNLDDYRASRRTSRNNGQYNPNGHDLPF